MNMHKAFLEIRKKDDVLYFEARQYTYAFLKNVLLSQNLGKLKEKRNMYKSLRQIQIDSRMESNKTIEYPQSNKKLSTYGVDIQSFRRTPSSLNLILLFPLL